VLQQEKIEAEARRDQIKLKIERSVMKSPVSGTVLKRHLRDERMVSAGSVLLEIGTLDDLEVEADILSQDAVGVTKDQDVDVFGPAVGKNLVRGKVAQVYPAGFTKMSSLGVEQQRVKVIVRLPAEVIKQLRQERNIGVGYRVRVRIFTASRSQALRIPRSALFRGAGGEWQTFVVRDGRAKLQAIDVGLMNDELVEVKAGLNDGDLVILAPEANLADDSRVRPLLQNSNGK
jgi:HlyD family secretion protein